MSYITYYIWHFSLMIGSRTDGGGKAPCVYLQRWRSPFAWQTCRISSCSTKCGESIGLKVNQCWQQEWSYKVQCAQKSATACKCLVDMAQFARVSRSVGLITLQNPPVNALRWAAFWSFLMFPVRRKKRNTVMQYVGWTFRTKHYRRIKHHKLAQENVHTS